jgi:NAD+ diphosphatase
MRIPPLSRGSLDRAAARRRDAAWLQRAWTDPASRVLVVDDRGRAAIDEDGAVPTLALMRPTDVPGTASLSIPGLRPTGPGASPGGDRDDAGGNPDGRATAAASGDPDAGGAGPYLLGVDDAGTSYWALRAPLPRRPGLRVAGLREVGGLLPDRDAGMLVAAVALANWHSTHTHCPRCGAETEVADAGYQRRCPADGSEHFPRTDPAVIMLVHDGGDHCLLGRQPSWPAGRFSTLAGFVEPGEPAEQAVLREVGEETGVAVRDVTYAASQPWPFPASLMLGFYATADPGSAITLGDGELAEARWFHRDELVDAAVLLPGPTSIARVLIETWRG